LGLGQRSPKSRNIFAFLCIIKTLPHSLTPRNYKLKGGCCSRPCSGEKTPKLLRYFFNRRPMVFFLIKASTSVFSPEFGPSTKVFSRSLTRICIRRRMRRNRKRRNCRMFQRRKPPSGCFCSCIWDIQCCCPFPRTSAIPQSDFHSPCNETHISAIWKTSLDK